MTDVSTGGVLDQQGVEGLLSIREPFLKSQLDFGNVVIHGHTPAQ